MADFEIEDDDALAAGGDKQGDIAKVEALLVWTSDAKLSDVLACLGSSAPDPNASSYTSAQVDYALGILAEILLKRMAAAREPSSPSLGKLHSAVDWAYGPSRLVAIFIGPDGKVIREATEGEIREITRRSE